MSDMTAESQSHAADHGHGHGHQDVAAKSENQKFAMWLFLASEVIIFTAMIAPWIIFRIQEPDLVKEFHKAAGLEGILLVTFNTFLLLTSSWAMVMGLRQITKGNAEGLVRWLSVTAVLGVAFLFLQYVEYQQLAHEGLILQFADDEWSGMGARFYGPTAFHGAHVFIGVLWTLFVIYNARRGEYSAEDHVGVEVFGLYWHFVDVGWILLFTLIYLI